MRTHCSFEAALKWYRLAFDPLNQDCTWVYCPENSQQGLKQTAVALPPAEGETSNTACCDSTKVSAAAARNRSIILHFLETLLEWGEAAMRRNSPEHVQQARLLFDTMESILGKRPVSLQLPEPATPQTVANYVPDSRP